VWSLISMVVTNRETNGQTNMSYLLCYYLLLCVVHTMITATDNVYN